MIKFCRNRSENIREIDVFVRSLHANFDKNGLNVKKFAKNRVLKQTAQKDQYRCKMTRSTKWYLEILKFWGFDPKISKNRYFWENVYKIHFLEIWKTGTYLIEPHVYYLHTKF